MGGPRPRQAAADVSGSEQDWQIPHHSAVNSGNGLHRLVDGGKKERQGQTGSATELEFDVGHHRVLL